MAQMQTRSRPQPPNLQLEPFRGVNFSVTPTQIDHSQSPDMLNMNIDERGALNKRTGYERVFLTSLGPGKIDGLYHYIKSDGTSFFLIVHNGKLYKQSGYDQPIELFSGLTAGRRVNFFTMNDKCYLMDGTNYLEFDGTSVKQITPYIPTITVSREPAGGGTKHEDWNLLGAGFKDSFSADGTAKDFILSHKALDATKLTANVNGTEMTEGNGFTVDRTAGKVTFTTVPAKGTNNVIITAYKTQSGLPDRIKKCRFHVIFGGSNDTRVFVSGNPSMPEYVWRLGLYDPTYAPENGFYKYPGKVKGFARQYDYLVVERENGKHQVSYELDSSGNATFPSKPINDQIGTLAAFSIQLVENNPVSLSKSGVYMLVASNVRDERNVAHISEAIDPRLLKEENFENAVSIDYDRKYWLALNNRVYVLDYAQKSEENPFGEWYIYDNIPAYYFFEMNSRLYFGSRNEGLVYRFKKESDAFAYNDDGMAINSYWKSKYITFGTDSRRKLVEKIFFSMKPSAKTSANIRYLTDKKESGITKRFQMNLFDFRNLDFSNFTFITSSFPRVVMAKIKAKKITHFQVIIENNQLDESLGVLSLGIKFRYQNEVK